MTRATTPGAAFAGATGLALAVLVATALGVGACNGSFRFDEPVLPTDGGGDELTASSTCTDDTTCQGMRCETTTAVCVACLQDGDCSGSLSHCDGTAHVCVECESTLDCGTKQVCDSTTHRCLDACNGDDDVCPVTGFTCKGAVHLCVECRLSANCAGSPNGRVCDIPIGRCVECTGNAQCAGATPACDRRSGRCVGCVTSAACNAGTVCDKSALVCR